MTSLVFNSIKLTGFKSFVEPTEFLIEPGLTGIVGTNGCGKSNLLEAIRWVMGANSAKASAGLPWKMLSLMAQKQGPDETKLMLFSMSIIQRVSHHLPLMTAMNWKLCGLWRSQKAQNIKLTACLLYTSQSPRDQRGSRMPSSA